MTDETTAAVAEILDAGVLETAIKEEALEEEAGTDELPGIHNTGISFGGTEILTDERIELDDTLYLVVAVKVNKKSVKRDKEGLLHHSASGPTRVIRQLDREEATDLEHGHNVEDGCPSCPHEGR